jgi:hypothetical protein
VSYDFALSATRFRHAHPTAARGAPGLVAAENEFNLSGILSAAGIMHADQTRATILTGEGTE